MLGGWWLGGDERRLWWHKFLMVRIAERWRVRTKNYMARSEKWVYVVWVVSWTWIMGVILEVILVSVTVVQPVLVHLPYKLQMASHPLRERTSINNDDTATAITNTNDHEQTWAPNKKNDVHVRKWEEGEQKVLDKNNIQLDSSHFNVYHTVYCNRYPFVVSSMMHS